MSFFDKTLIIASGLLITHSASAEITAEKYIWSDSKGLQSADACIQSESADVDFRVDVSRSTENILIVATEAEKKNSMMRDPGDYVIEVARDLHIKTIGSTSRRFAGSFWQVEIDADKFGTFICGPAKKQYVVFNVFVTESNMLVAQVGVSPTDAKLFRHAWVHTPEEAEKAIAEKSASNPSFAKLRNNGSTVSIQATKPSVATASGGAIVSGAPTTTQSGSSPLHASSAEQTQARNPHQPHPAAPSSGPKEQAPVSTISIETPKTSGTLDYVVCIASGTIQVRDSKLRNVIFAASPLERVMPIQAFGAESQTKVIAGKSYKFIKAQFPDRSSSNNTGWMAESFVQLKSKCEFVKQPEPPVTEPTSSGTIASLTDSNCCDFPVANRPLQSYREGMRRFRASRSKGRRLHAACDLYRPGGEKVVSIAPGTVIRGKYFFYQGVYAVEVRHAGGFVVRYGEVLGRNAPDVSEGSRLMPGQTLGYVGTVNSGCCSPMLHFELYSGKSAGGLTQPSHSGFQRREDLLDPTSYLQKWEHAAFGANF